MPTYDYKCDACGAVWEVFQSIKAAPIKKCPSCGKNKAKRQIGAGAGIIFRGSGFYSTDYRSDSYKKGADAAKKSESTTSSGSSDSGSNGKSESKPTSTNTSAE